MVDPADEELGTCSATPPLRSWYWECRFKNGSRSLTLKDPRTLVFQHTCIHISLTPVLPLFPLYPVSSLLGINHLSVEVCLWSPHIYSNSPLPLSHKTRKCVFLLSRYIGWEGGVKRQGWKRMIQSSCLFYCRTTVTAVTTRFVFVKSPRRIVNFHFALTFSALARRLRRCGLWL